VVNFAPGSSDRLVETNMVGKATVRLSLNTVDDDYSGLTGLLDGVVKQS
jgi:hypothetical protein